MRLGSAWFASDSPWCHSTARNPFVPSARTRATSCWYSAPSDSHALSLRRTRAMTVGGDSNNTPVGNHSRTLVPPLPTHTKPTGTPNSIPKASPNGGMKLPPSPLAPGCGSRASCQPLGPKAITPGLRGVCRSSP